MKFTKLQNKYKISAILFGILPILIAFIDHPLLHGNYGLISLAFCLVGMVFMVLAIMENRREYYSKLTVNDVNSH